MCFLCHPHACSHLHSFHRNVSPAVAQELEGRGAIQRGNSRGYVLCGQIEGGEYLVAVLGAIGDLILEGRSKVREWTRDVGVVSACEKWRHRHG